MALISSFAKLSSALPFRKKWYRHTSWWPLRCWRREGSIGPRSDAGNNSLLSQKHSTGLIFPRKGIERVPAGVRCLSRPETNGVGVGLKREGSAATASIFHLIWKDAPPPPPPYHSRSKKGGGGGLINGLCARPRYHLTPALFFYTH